MEKDRDALRDWEAKPRLLVRVEGYFRENNGELWGRAQSWGEARVYKREDRDIWVTFRKKANHILNKNVYVYILFLFVIVNSSISSFGNNVNVDLSNLILKCYLFF